METAVKQYLAAAGRPRIDWGSTDKVSSTVQDVLLPPPQAGESWPAAVPQH